MHSPHNLWWATWSVWFDSLSSFRITTYPVCRPLQAWSKWQYSFTLCLPGFCRVCGSDAPRKNWTRIDRLSKCASANVCIILCDSLIQWIIFVNYLFWIRPLHIAARNGLVVVTQTLLEKGASLTVIDVNGYNPALSCAPNAAVADCLSMIIHIMIDSVTNNGRRSDSLILSNLGNT